jgi:hypothetical protein
LYLTTQERAVQGALDAFWYEHYTQPYTTEQRNKLAEGFIAKWLDPSKIKTDKQFVRHPATKNRLKNRNYTVADVLADFIMRVDQVAERKAEFPVENTDRQVNGAMQRQETELSIYFRDDLDKPPEERKPLPPYSVRANDIVMPNSVEDVLFTEHTPDVARFRAELRRVKKYAEFYATSFAEEYGFDKADTLRRIKRLDLSRVRECEICGGAFYAHDFRRHVCDTQRGIKTVREKGKAPVYVVTDESACELERERKTAKERAKIRDLVEEKSI